jgi:uncharacterized protein YqgQ/preprotein translocase subunit SecG
MHVNQLKLLEYLESEGIFGATDISRFVERLYPKPLNENTNELDEQRHKILAFLKILKYYGYIEYDDKSLKQIGMFKSDFEHLYDETELFAAITDKGIEALEKERSRKNQEILNLSLLETNTSTLATNKSVKQMNDLMAEVSKEQLILNRSIVENSDGQTKILIRQTYIFFFTAIFALGSLILSFMTLYSIKDEDKLQLQAQSKQINSLRHQILHFKTDSSKESEIKKISLKK